MLEKSNPTEHDQSQLAPFLAKAGEWSVAVTKTLPNGLRTVVVLLGINGVSNGALAWQKGEWFAYVIMNLTQLVVMLTVLVLQRQKKNDEQRENTS